MSGEVTVSIAAMNSDSANEVENGDSNLFVSSKNKTTISKLTASENEGDEATNQEEDHQTEEIVDEF